MNIHPFIRFPFMVVLNAFAVFFITIQPNLTAQARLESVIQKTDFNNITDAKFVQGENMLVMSTLNGHVRLWEPSTGRIVRSYEGHTDYVRGIALTRDEATLISGGWDRAIRIYDFKTGKTLRTFKADRSINRLSFSSPGNKIAVRSFDENYLTLWDMESGNSEERQVSGLGGKIVCHPKRPSLVFVSFDTIKVWETDRGIIRPLYKIKDRTRISWLAIDDQGRWIGVGMGNGKILILDADTGSFISEIQGHKEYVGSMMFHPVEDVLLTSADDGYIRLWQLPSLKETGSWKIKGKRPAVFDISPSGRHVALCQDLNNLSVMTFPEGKIINTIGSETSVVYSAKFCHDNRHLLTGNRIGAISLWDLGTGRLAQTYHGGNAAFAEIALLKNESQILAVNYDKTTFCFDRYTGEELYRVEHDQDFNVALVADELRGRFITAGKDSMVKVWSVESGEMIMQFDAYEDPPDNWDPYARIQALAMDPQKRYLCSGGYDRHVRIWDADSYQLVHTFEPLEAEIRTAAFSPDSKLLCVGCEYPEKNMYLYDINTFSLKKKLFTDMKWAGDLSFSPDGTRILCVGGAGEVQLWDVQSGQCIGNLEGHEAVPVTFAVFSHDGRSFTTGGYDHTFKIWDARSGLCQATFVPVRDQDFIIQTPDHYYTSSRSGLGNVYFRQNEVTYPFDQFDLHYNRPDIVIERLGRASSALVNAYHNAYLKRLRRMGFTESDIQGQTGLPEIQVLNALPISTNQKVISLSIEARDKVSAIDRINVFVNDVPVFGMKGKPVEKHRSKKIRETIELELTTGNNKIQISCHNTRGLESLKENFDIDYTGQMTRSDLYVMGIGVSRYQDEQFNLDFAAADAERVAELFRENHNGGFDSVRVRLFLDERATRMNIMQTKTWLGQTRVDDSVILFVAGHGILDSLANYYIATYDINFLKPGENGLPYEDLTSLLDGIPARRKLLLIDACHSGEIEENTRLAYESVRPEGVRFKSVRGVQMIQENKKEILDAAELSKLLELLFVDLRRDTGASILTASSGEQVSYESENWQGGVFTYSLLHGIEQLKADTDGDQRIRVSELRDYVMRTVPELTGGHQTPKARRENLADDFMVW